MSYGLPRQIIMFTSNDLTASGMEVYIKWSLRRGL